MAPILTLFRSDDRPGDSGWFYAGPIIATEDRAPISVARIGDGMRRMSAGTWRVAMAYYPATDDVRARTTRYLDANGWHEIKP